FGSGALRDAHRLREIADRAESRTVGIRRALVGIVEDRARCNAERREHTRGEELTAQGSHGSFPVNATPVGPTTMPTFVSFSAPEPRLIVKYVATPAATTVAAPSAVVTMNMFVAFACEASSSSF